MKIDIVIPTYKPDQTLIRLLEKIQEQSVPINKIIVMNTEQSYFDELDKTIAFQKRFVNMEVYHIGAEEFDHGNTRNWGIEQSDADVVVCMTQDAVPADQFLIENLVEPLCKNSVVSTYAKQLPNELCGIVEQYTRSFNYPDQSFIKTREDIERLGIKTYFCSNVCAAYNRNVWNELGGFTKHTIFNEDMIYAAAVIKAGYSIAYVAEARVIHSHNYTNVQQFRRNFDLGVSQAEHPEVFADVPSESEGIKLVKQTIGYLYKNHYKRLIIPTVITSGYKFIGFQMGKRYQKISCKIIRKCTMNANYWK